MDSASGQIGESMHYLITGGAGFIGYNLSSRLFEMGNQITILDTLKHNTKVPPRNTFYAYNIMNYPDVLSACAGVDVVVHLAANTGVLYSIEHPQEDLENNILGTLNCLEAAKQSGVSRFVFASSGAVLGNGVPPFKETVR